MGVDHLLLSELRKDRERYLGTPGLADMGRVLEESLRRVGYEVERQPVEYTAWHLDSVPRLELLGHEGPPRIPSRAMIYSPSVEVSGPVTYAGRQKLIGVFNWRHFHLRGSGGEVVANLVAADSGPCLPLSHQGPEGQLPTVIMGARDGDLLESILEKGDLYVRLSLSSHFSPGKTFDNVVGTLHGGCSSGREVLICAHYDTMYRSPGANDNGSGLLCALRLAERLAETGLAHDTCIRIVFFGGEEMCQLGSRDYLQRRMAAGTHGSINLVLNLDMVGRGEYFWPWVDESTQGALEEALESTPCQYPVEMLNPPLAGDHYPFFEEGISAACFIWWPDPDYHQPGDTSAKLDHGKVNYTALLAVSFITGFMGR